MSWVKSKIETDKKGFSFEAEHRSDVLPSELSKVLTARADFKFGVTPRGVVHTIVVGGKPIKVAVRPLDSFKGFFYFHALKDCHDKKMDVVDTPIALVTSKRGRVSHLITEWREGAVNLKEYFANNSVSLDRRLEIARLAMKEVAKLHSSGYFHGHPHLGNFVTYPQASEVKVHMVDPTMLNTGFKNVNGYDHFSEAVIAAIGFIQNLRGLKKFDNVPADDPLFNDLLHAYLVQLHG